MCISCPFVVAIIIWFNGDFIFYLYMCVADAVCQAAAAWNCWMEAMKCALLSVNYDCTDFAILLSLCSAALFSLFSTSVGKACCRYAGFVTLFIYDVYRCFISCNLSFGFLFSDPRHFLVLLVWMFNWTVQFSNCVSKRLCAYVYIYNDVELCKFGMCHKLSLH